MGKISKVLVCGHAGVGKTAAIEHLIYGNHSVGSVSMSDIDIDWWFLHHCINFIYYSVFINLDRTVQKLWEFDLRNRGLNTEKMTSSAHDDIDIYSPEYQIFIIVLKSSYIVTL